MRVLYFGTYRAEYSRNRIMIAALREAGVEVVECHARLWRGIDDRVAAATGGWTQPGFWLRLAQAYADLIRQHRRVGDYDLMVAGYPGQLDVFLARLLSRQRKKPLAWDLFMSIYLIAVERGLDRRSPASIGLLRRLEKAALGLPDLLIQDTQDYVAWFGSTYGVPPGRFRLVPTGADDRIFHPVEAESTTPGIFRALYYGTFIPNHGVEQIIEAARLLADRPAIRFELVGDGPERAKARSLAESYGLRNVRFVDWLEPEQLVRRAAGADACLGAFGTTPQSLMTVQNKIYEGLAMGKAVITGDSPAVRREMIPGVHLLVCDRRDPASLAEAVQILAEYPDLARSLGSAGRALFEERYSIRQLGRQYRSHLEELLSVYSGAR